MTKLYIPLNIQRFAVSSSISCTQIGEPDIPNNKTTQRITFTVTRTGGTTYWSDAKTVTFTVDGGTYTTTMRFPSGSVGATASCYVDVTVAHNSDGTKSISYSASIKTGTSAGTVTASGSSTLATIPRYANITSFNVWGYSETEIQFGWGADANCDYLQTSVNGGAWTDNSTGIVGGLSAGTQYSLKIRVRRADSGLWTESSTLNTITYDYPYANSMPNFTIGQPLTIGLYNPLSRNTSVYLILDNGTEVGYDQVDGNSIGIFTIYTDDFYKSIPNKPSGTYQVKVVYGSSTITKIGGTYTIDYGVSKPTFNHFTYKDINERTLALTGNDENVIVNGFSTVEVSVVGNEGNGYLGSSIKNYTVNGNSFTTTYPIQNFSGTSIKVFAIDTRDNTSDPVELPITNLLDYESIIKTTPVANRSDDGIGSQITFEFGGKFWNKKFGDADNAVTNTLSAKYKYKQLGASEYNEEIAIDINDINISENGTFSFNKILAGDGDDNGFDIQKSYSVVITVSDELSVAEYTYIISEGSPAIDLVGNRIALGGYYDETLLSKVQANGGMITLDGTVLFYDDEKYTQNSDGSFVEK